MLQDPGSQPWKSSGRGLWPDSWSQAGWPLLPGQPAIHFQPSASLPTASTRIISPSPCISLTLLPRCQWTISGQVPSDPVWTFRHFLSGWVPPGNRREKIEGLWGWVCVWGERLGESGSGRSDRKGGFDGGQVS